MLLEYKYLEMNTPDAAQSFVGLWGKGRKGRDRKGKPKRHHLGEFSKRPAVVNDLTHKPTSVPAPLFFRSACPLEQFPGAYPPLARMSASSVQDEQCTLGSEDLPSIVCDVVSDPN